jgi:hypothetical protein
MQLIYQTEMLLLLRSMAPPPSSSIKFHSLDSLRCLMANIVF